MTKKDIDNIISVICPNDEDFEKACISPAYLKKELEALALEQEPCEDCISREAVLDLAEKGVLVSNGNYKSLCKAINELPSVKPKERTGKWEKTTDEYCYWYKCSACGCKVPKNEWGTDYFSPYCPECGVKMKEGEEE